MGRPGGACTVELEVVLFGHDLSLEFDALYEWETDGRPVRYDYGRERIIYDEWTFPVWDGQENIHAFSTRRDKMVPVTPALAKRIGKGIDRYDEQVNVQLTKHLCGG